jgi:hypothetical protein
MQDESSEKTTFEVRMDARLRELVERSAAHPARPLFHYTKADGLMGILGKRTVHATHYRYLNDRSEIGHGEDRFRDVIQDLLGASEAARHHDTLGHLAKAYEVQKLSSVVDIFVASFTEEGNLLSQWRAYGANGGGYSLGFSKLAVDHDKLETVGAAAGLYKCDYDDGDIRRQMRSTVLDLLDAVEEHAHLLAGASRVEIIMREALVYLLHAAVAFIPALKHKSFREEREWRLVVFPLHNRAYDAVQYRACPRRGLVPFIEVPLVANSERLPVTEIFLGPTHEQEASRAALRGYLTKLGYENAEELVSESGIPFRE